MSDSATRAGQTVPERNAQFALAAQMAGDWWAARLGNSYRDKANVFAAAVAKRVEARLLAGAVGVVLTCDYEPWDDLLDAVRETVEPDRFRSGTAAQTVLPRKHTLIVGPHELKGKEGYGNWTPTIAVPSVERLGKEDGPK